jgi:hypothetical protein
MAFKVSKKFQDMMDRNEKISSDARAVEERWKSWTPPKQNTNDIFQDTTPNIPQTTQPTFKKKEIPKFDFSSVGNFIKSAGDRYNYTPDQQTTNSQNWLDRWTEQTRQNLKGNLQDNLLTAAYNKVTGNKPSTYTKPNIDYNTGMVGDISSGLAGMATDPLTYASMGIGSLAGKALTGSAKLAKAGNLSKFLVPLAGEGAAFGGVVSAGDELKNAINNPSQINLGSSIGKTIGGATAGALGNVALGGLLKGIGKGVSGISELKNLKGKSLNLKANEVPKEWSSYPSSPFSVPEVKPYSGKFTVNTNRAAQQAQQDLEDAIVAVQNHFGTNQLTPDEIARVKPELGIDFEALIARVENPQVDIRGIGERAKYGQHIGLNDVMARPDQSLYNLKYPRDIMPEPRPLQTPVFNQQTPIQSQPQADVLAKFKKDIVKKKVSPVNNAHINPLEPQNNLGNTNIPITPNNATVEPNITSRLVQQMESKVNTPVNTPNPTINPTPPQVNPTINQPTKEVPINKELPRTPQSISNEPISQFRTNTLERYTKITPEERAQLTPENYSFIRETNKKWQDGAATSVEKDMYEVMDRLTKQESLTGGIDSAEGALIGEKLLQKARETGNPLDMAEYRKWTEIIAEKTRETARALKSTDFSYDKSTPTGAVMKAQKVIDSVVPDEMVPKINAEAKKIRFEIKRVDDEALDQIAKEFDEIINPKNFKYEMAKEIAPEKNLDRFIKSNLKEMGVNVGKLVRDFKQQDKINDITRYMVENSGLSEPEATALANQIKTRLAQITADKKKQIVTNMFKEKKVSIPKTDFEKTMELINLGAYDDATIKNLIKKREKLPVLETEDIQKIIEHMDNADKIPDKKSYEYKHQLALASDVMADKLPATWKDYYLTTRYVSMLGNPKTGIRNVLGNAILMPFEGAKNTIMAPVDKLISLKTGNRTTFAPTLKSNKILFKGMGKGAKETYLDLKYGVNTNPTPGQFEINKKRIFKKVPVLNQLEKAVNFMMSIGDRPFYQGVDDKSLYQIMKHNKTNTPTPEMIDYAKKIAKDATYTNDSSLAEKASEIKRGFGPIGDIIMPFVKTPSNIADKFLDYLPTGFVKAAFELGKGSKNKIAKEFYKGLYKDSKNLEFDQKKFVDRLGRAIVGSGIIGGSSALASSDKITGSQNKNKALANIEKQAGKLPFAIKNGNDYTSYDWAQPISTLMATGANLGNNKMTKKDAMLESAKLLQNQSFLKGISDLFSSGNVSTGLYNALVKAPGQFNPTLAKQVGKLNDPYEREKSGEPRINALGKPVLQNYGNNTFFNNFINPARTATYNPTKSEKLIIDLANKTGKTDFLPVQQDETFKSGGKEFKMTPEQLTQFRVNIGQGLDKVYNQLLNNKTFNSSTDDQKMKIISNFKDKIVKDAQQKAIDSKYKMPNYNNEAISQKQFEIIRDELYKEIDSKYKLTKNQKGKIIKDVNYDKNTKAKQAIQDKISAKNTNNMSESQKLELIKQLRKKR